MDKRSGTALRFRRLRKKLAVATPTPWRAAKDYGCKKIGGGKIGKAKQGQYQDIAYTVGLNDEPRDRANADLIAESVTLLPYLLDAVEYAREYLHSDEDDEDCPCAICEAIRRVK